MKRKVLSMNRILILASFILLMFIVVIGANSTRVYGLDPIDETPPIEEELPPVEEDLPPIENEDVIIIEEDKLGFFESIVTGFFNFVTSVEFTALVSSLSMIAGVVYIFARKYLTAKGDAKYRKITGDLLEAKDTILKYEELVRGYAAVVDGALKQQNAISDSLKLGFDNSNLKQDIKDSIKAKLNDVPDIVIPVIEEVKPIVVKMETKVIDKFEENIIKEVKPELNKGW